MVVAGNTNNHHLLNLELAFSELRKEQQAAAINTMSEIDKQVEYAM